MLLPLFTLTNVADNYMARTIRKKSGTGIYHVMLRGINRQDIFEECGQILDIDTDDCKSVSDSDVKAFLLMNQHIVNPLMVQRRNGVLRSALSIGAGIRQLSRLTGVSFGIIQKLRNDH